MSHDPKDGPSDSEINGLRLRILELELLQKESSTLVYLVARAADLFEAMAKENHRKPPDDHVEVETWNVVQEWLELPEVQTAVLVLRMSELPQV
jgi:hypothetical protein